MKTAEQHMREALGRFISDPPETDFQRGFVEGLKVFAKEAMGFKWDDPLLWGRSAPHSKFDGGEL